MKHLKSTKLNLAVFTAFSLTACATPPYVPTVYDASTSSVKTIALADNSLPDTMGANELASHTGTGQAAGGLIGYLVVAAIEGAETSNRKGALETLMAPLNFDPEAEFEAMLKTKLADAGYEGLNMVNVKRNSKSALKSVPETNADAVLNVEMVKFGLQKAKTGAEWRPAAGVKVELVGTQTRDVLMENMISYNSGILGIKEKEGFITMAPKLGSTGYQKIKEMDPVIVRDEIMVMLEEISDMVVTLL
jgi:hypothetical protein